MLQRRVTASVPTSVATWLRRVGDRLTPDEPRELRIWPSTLIGLVTATETLWWGWSLEASAILSAGAWAAFARWVDPRVERLVERPPGPREARLLLRIRRTELRLGRLLWPLLGATVTGVGISVVGRVWLGDGWLPVPIAVLIVGAFVATVICWLALLAAAAVTAFYAPFRTPDPTLEIVDLDRSRARPVVKKAILVAAGIEAVAEELASHTRESIRPPLTR